MVGIITGDIMHSKRVAPKVWLGALKTELKKIGSSPKYWEIYRGDSFQVEITDPLEALMVAIKIKASVKSIKEIDVRMAIGIGNKSHLSNTITEANGTAFVFSGEKFEGLRKKKQTLAIYSKWEEFDKEINLYLRWAMIIMDDWSSNSAEIVKIALENPDKSQQALGKKLGIKQNAISSRLKRACYDEILALNEMYKAKLKALI
jgi:hypothetical protein